MGWHQNPEQVTGTASEKQGILRSGARMHAAQSQATGPKFEITMRNAYGFGSMVMIDVDEMIDPRETRNVLLESLEHGSRIGIPP